MVGDSVEFGSRFGGGLGGSRIWLRGMADTGMARVRRSAVGRIVLRSRGEEVMQTRGRLGAGLGECSGVDEDLLRLLSFLQRSLVVYAWWVRSRGATPHRSLLRLARKVAPARCTRSHSV